MTASDGSVWIGDRLVDAGAASLPYDDHGITVGDGVFETVRLDDGVPFALGRHLDRLVASAGALRLRVPDRDLLEHAVAAVVAAAPAPRDGFVRITVTAGRGPLASGRGEVDPTLVVAIRPGDIRTDPTDVVVVPWTRNEHGALAGVKSTSYAENVVALVAATEAGAGEALFANTAGNLCEGTGSNVFLVVDDELVTPPLSSGCLAGVTRGLLLEVGIGREADVAVGVLATAPEAFLVSTAREVQPIRAVDGVPLAACPGPHTRRAREAWLELRPKVE